MPRRLLSLAVLLVALAGAVWAGTLVRDRLDGPGPIPTVRAATMAYATGNCQALRDVSESPQSVDCAEVAQVQRAYHDEGLEPDRFTYAVVSQSGSTATVRVSYVKGSTPFDEMIPVEKDGSEWKIASVAAHLD
ncbi:hypothetical protein C6I20_07235 [Aeromicrobium sp. A1-2]|uniref:hypothetical protein n=1 Tax=Aeromicrobium sp. A1-2 TaxID=2107713 RepID=UPI000E51B22B|nr:hypothetical protein [Aeromicrobium sp. A1-2]AXT84999.1 hypothetical protein C6I20_07235 [Aeromicrobium sp. A1-2]